MNMQELVHAFIHIYIYICVYIRFLSHLPVRAQVHLHLPLHTCYLPESTRRDLKCRYHASEAQLQSQQDPMQELVASYCTRVAQRSLWKVVLQKHKKACVAGLALRPEGASGASWLLMYCQLLCAPLKLNRQTTQEALRASCRLLFPS